MTASDSSGARFDFGRVTARTFGLIGRNFVPFAVLSAIFAGIPYLLLLLIQPSLMQSDPSMAMVVVVLAVLVQLVVGIVLQAALTRASVDDLSGKGVAIGAALSTGLAVLLPMIGLGVLVSAGVIGGLILLIVPGIYLALRWGVAAPVVVVERQGVLAAMGRSAKLTENHRWAILGLIVLYAIFLIILQSIIGLLIPGAMATMSGLSPEGPSALVLLILVAVQIVNSMIATVGIASIYFELRQIKEGVDVNELAKVFA